jgi:hypothetical protein
MKVVSGAGLHVDARVAGVLSAGSRIEYLPSDRHKKGLNSLSFLTISSI